MINLVAIPFFILYLVVLTIVIVGIYQLLYNFHPDRRCLPYEEIPSSTCELPPVTILRPLKGLDADMHHTLSCSFNQDYPKFEIIFCVESETDPCIPLVQSLINENLKIDAKLLIDGITPENYGPNPKVNNLAKGYKLAKYDLLWIMDSNVWCCSKTLKRSVISMQKNLSVGSKNPCLLSLKSNVGLITHVPLVSAGKPQTGKHWGALLDEMFMSTSHAKFYSALNRLQPAPCINGKSNLFKRSDLDKAVSKITQSECVMGNGIRHFAQYIGEDNMIAIALWEIGLCAGMSMDFVVQPLSGQNSVFDYTSRRVRWLRVRKYMVLAATLLEPFTESIICGLIGSWSINVLFKKSNGIWFNWFIMHMMLWFISDWFQVKALNSYVNVQNREWFQWVMFWILRESLALPIWITAMFGHEIQWRGQPFRIKKDLSAERL
ncbi:hypothetical protein DAMA08_046980 [Martiniozyma asiatica (nom. inval.)]|nr:hypothetical protein DAMA08_046980 [Martiniozyma asiatica]